MQKSKILFYCPTCGFGWDIALPIEIGLETVKHISCPACCERFTFTIAISVLKEVA